MPFAQWNLTPSELEAQCLVSALPAPSFHHPSGRRQGARAKLTFSPSRLGGRTSLLGSVFAILGRGVVFQPEKA